MTAQSTANITKQKAINVALALHFFLVLTFDYMPDQVRLNLAGLISLLYAAIAITRATLRVNIATRYFLLCIGLMLVGWVLSYTFIFSESTDNNVGAVAAFRTLTPLFCIAAILACHKEISHRLLIVGCVFILISAVIHAIFSPQVYLGLSYRTAPFTAGLHTSAYTLVLSGLLMIELFQMRKLSGQLTFIFLVSALPIILTYDVRTAILLLLVFLAVDFAAKWARNRNATTVALMFTALIFLFTSVVAVFVIGNSFKSLNLFTSGRLSNYTERFTKLADRPIAEFFLGSGPGSDQVITSIWWWAEKDSHNDFLHLFWEGGIISIIAILLFIFILLRGEFWQMLGPIAALVLSSSASNALLARPNTIFLFSCIIALRYAKAPVWKKSSPKTSAGLTAPTPDLQSANVQLNDSLPTR